MMMALDAVTGLLPGLLPAVFRGVAFHMPDTTARSGRRIAEQLFPGLDHAGYDDLGALPEELSVSGVIVGDDYALAAQRLRSAFARPGPGTLIHPWFGPLMVLPIEPAEISLASNELRVVRFEATFTILRRGVTSGGIGTVAGLITSAVALIGSALAFGRSIRTNRQRQDRQLTAVIETTPIARGGFVLPKDGAATVLDQVADWTRAEVDARAAAIGAATAPVAAAAEADPIDPGTAASGIGALHRDLRATAAQLTDAARIAPAEAPMLHAAAAVLIAQAARMFIHDMPANRAEAIGVRDSFTTVLQDVRGAAIPAAAAAHEMERHAAALEAAIAADINEIIGRLPRTWTMALDDDGDAWMIAHHLFGDDPGAVQSAYDALVERNRLRHPSLIEAGQALEIER